MSAEVALLIMVPCDVLRDQTATLRAPRKNAIVE